MRFLGGYAVGDFTLNLEGVLLDCSEVFVKLLGYPNTSSTTQVSTWQDCFESESLATMLNKAKTNSHLKNQELQLKRKDGQVINVLVTLTKATDQERGYGVIEGSLVELREPTDTDNMLQMTLNQLNAVLDAVPGIISWVGSDMRYLGINRQAEIYAGLKAEEIIGQHVGIQNPQSEFVQFVHDFFTSPDQESRREIVCRVQGKPMNLLLVSRKYSSNSAAVIVGIDITEQKRSEEKIKEQATLLRRTTDAIFVQNSEKKIVYWNNGAEVLFGWMPLEVADKSIDQLIYEEDRLEFEKAVAILHDSGEWSGEIRMKTRSEIVRTTHSRLTLMNGKKKTETSILFVSTDITEKKQLEQQLYRTQRMNSLGTLAGGIAHDLNNILAPILLGLQLLKMKHPNEDDQQMFDIIEVSAKRGAQLVKQILTFARGIESQFNLMQVKYLIKDVWRIVGDMFPKNIKFTTKVPNNIWMIVGDMTQLTQVFLNLCVNARDAMPTGGSLKITAENMEFDRSFVAMYKKARLGKYVAISVIDSGKGMVPEVVDKIFEPFFTTKPLGKGTGLGLSTAIGIIQSHNGFIDVKSQPGEGTSFKIFLPAESSEEIVSTAEVENSPKGNGEQILVVDDEVSICEISKETLEAYNYHVLTAVNGAEATALFARYMADIALVLTDMKMPIMDGVATIYAVKQLKPEVKIIAMSGLASGKKGLDRVKDEINAYLDKPFTSHMLLKTIHEVLQAKSTSSTQDGSIVN